MRHRIRGVSYELCNSYKEYNTIILCRGQLMAIVAWIDISVGVQESSLSSLKNCLGNGWDNPFLLRQKTTLSFSAWSSVCLGRSGRPTISVFRHFSSVLCKRDDLVQLWEIRLSHLPFLNGQLYIVSTEGLCKWSREVIIEVDGVRVDEKLGVTGRNGGHSSFLAQCIFVRRYYLVLAQGSYHWIVYRSIFVTGVCGIISVSGRCDQKEDIAWEWSTIEVHMICVCAFVLEWESLY